MTGLPMTQINGSAAIGGATSVGTAGDPEYDRGCGRAAASDRTGTLFRRVAFSAMAVEDGFVAGR
jgi:hypothetical protein